MRVLRVPAVACLVLFGLANCMPSEYPYLSADGETLEIWLAECADDRNDFVTRERYCTLAINSGELYQDELADAFYWRASAYYNAGDYERAIDEFSETIRLQPDGASAYEARGNALLEAGYEDEAEQDYLTAYEITGDRRLAGYAREIDQERARRREANRRFAVRYEGLWCGAIQKDSFVAPKNEIKLQAIVYGRDGQAQGVDLPARNRHYGGVTPGYRSSRGRQDVWIGGPQLLTLTAIMWEHDDGGALVDLAAYVAVEAAMARVTPPGVPPGQVTGAAFGPGVIDGAVAKVAKGILGTDNDLMGTYHYKGFDPRAYVDRSPRRAYGINYHIATRHQAGGANCRAYFSVREI